MAITVEDGSGVAGANSYISIADAKAWASSRGLTFPTVDADVEKVLLSAMDYLESLRAQYSGSKSDPANPLQWPRQKATLDGVLILPTVIPTELKSAQVQLAYEAQTTELQPTGSGQEVASEQVDVLNVSYFKRGLSTVQPQFNKALAFLQPLLKTGGAFGVRTVRV